ncbi:ABC transporter permease [Mycoplasmatota bacterium]|nr:ABC transporter permease [Mycoplasmatota bacterium]
MKTFIIRRLLISIIVLFGVSIILYTIIRLLPSNYVDSIMRGNPKITPERIDHMKDLYGLNSGIIEGYFDWIVKALKGDFGNSFISGSPVIGDIKDKMWTSFWLALISLILEVLIAVPLGVIAATKQYSKTDYSVTVIALMGISLPSFFFAIVLQQIFAVHLGILPLQGMVDARSHQFMSQFGQYYDIFCHFILPITVLTMVGMGGLMRYTRTNMLEVLKSDYIRTARAKGLSEKTVFYKHAFRNTLIPIVTILGGTLPALFAGAMITETIFSIPGLGRAGLNAITQGDIPYIMTFNMFIAILTLLGTLLADITYAIVDPRVRLS